MWLVAWGAAWAATPYAGLEWRPLSRGDLSWVEQGDGSGLLVGGSDGFVRPQLLGYAGAWATDRIGMHASLGVARLQSTTWAEEVYVQRHWGVVRPAIDVRVALLERTDHRPIPWVFLGGHIDVPSARATSNGFTADERDAANQAATIDRVRLGGLGGRLGAGADLALLPALRIGMQWAVGWQRTMFRGTDPTAITQWVLAEGSLLVEIHWPRRVPDISDDAAADPPPADDAAAP